MVTPQSLYASLAPLGFESAGPVCFGSWRGYAVNLRSAQYSIFQLSFAVRANKKDKALLKTVQKEGKAQLGKSLSAVLNQGDSFLFTLRFNDKSDYAEQFRHFADVIASVLERNGLTPACTCAVCGGGMPESLCLMNTYQPVHAACMRQKTENAKEAAEDNKENGSYLTGLVGALIGALVGTIPTILVLVTTSTIYSLLFALVPLAAMYGYRLFKGKSNTASIVMIVILSLLSVCFIAFMWIVFGVMEGFHSTFGQALSITFDALTMDLFMQALGEFWQGFLFMVLGLIVSWSYLNKTSVSEARSAEALLGTLRPNPAYAAEQPGAYAETLKS